MLDGGPETDQLQYESWSNGSRGGNNPCRQCVCLCSVSMHQLGTKSLRTLAEENPRASEDGFCDIRLVVMLACAFCFPKRSQDPDMWMTLKREAGTGNWVCSQQMVPQRRKRTRAIPYSSPPVPIAHCGEEVTNPVKTTRTQRHDGTALPSPCIRQRAHRA